MAALEEELINGIRALPPEQVAVLDRWIDSDPQAVQVLVRAVPSMRPLLEPFISGNGDMNAAGPQMQAQQAPSDMSGAQLLTSIAGR